MFQKSNPKGMALLLHPLLCIFDEIKYKAMLSVAWFPYSMVELKEFKSLALQIQQELVLSGVLPYTLVSKSILETAAGVRLWQSLRNLSDYCLLFDMRKYQS
mmetsp:Transcript_18369/g.17482  ORF Transcript_18369/g.17482 Transcript_18369/m.17482 type:complete len:102 (-) Transcript_18369:65-370(-)